MIANASATGGVRETSCTDRNTTMKNAAHRTANAPADSPISPARSRSCRVLEAPAWRGARGSTNADQISSSPTPTPSPTTGPISAALVQELGEVDAGLLESLLPWRHPGSSDEVGAAAHEDRLYLDRIALGAARHRHDLADPTYAVEVDAEMNDEVHRRGDGRDDEPRRDVLPRQQWKRAHLHEGLAGAVRVQRCHPGEPGVQRQQEVQTLLGPDLADDDPRRPH